MDSILKTGLWQQFGAAIDMLDNAISACPDELWTASLWNDSSDKPYSQVWYIAYHTLVWLDLYLTGSSEGFAPPAPFVRGVLPEKPYTKDQIRTYLIQCRKKCQETIEGLTDEKARQVCKFEWMEPTFFELQIYCMRHVQEHAAQLSLLIGRDNATLTDWVSIAEDKA
jgi:hypothetical protein